MVYKQIPNINKTPALFCRGAQSSPDEHVGWCDSRRRRSFVWLDFTRAGVVAGVHECARFHRVRACRASRPQDAVLALVPNSTSWCRKYGLRLPLHLKSRARRAHRTPSIASDCVCRHKLAAKHGSRDDSGGEIRRGTGVAQTRAPMHLPAEFRVWVIELASTDAFQQTAPLLVLILVPTLAFFAAPIIKGQPTAFLVFASTVIMSVGFSLPSWLSWSTPSSSTSLSGSTSKHEPGTSRWK
ncbi:hypothetical protein DFP72DRAFT_1065092 [Ephemerocybe angulata]|uniref:Uncharacterized protein n=1 Tax=Ephemerocybe angulata TaxID=980116 RepID=A0A8H6MBU4_9AGAR|nr:hypothetical protein DFP72DRAFT_1065092 [Tulosesus angulatus]